MEDIFTTDFLDLGKDGVQAAVTTVEDTTGVFDDYRMQPRAVPGRPNELYMPWGADNQLPYRIRELIGSDEVTAQNKFFNVLTCYRAGLRLLGADGKETKHPDALRFARRNALSTFFLEQTPDTQYVRVTE